MLEDVPLALTNLLRAMLATGDFDKAEHYAAATAVIAHYVGPQITIDLVTPANDLLICNIAQHLFAMRNVGGFSEFCRRMRTRNIKSSFFELASAKLFLDRGYCIDCWPEKNIKKKDFDFRASLGECCVNVEATTLSPGRYALNNVMNALNQKRKQVPDTAPAIIFCQFPYKWFEQKPFDPQFDLFYATCKFFAGTRRINAIVFVTFQEVRLVSGGLMLFIWKCTFANQQPRIPFDVSFLYDDSLGGSTARMLAAPNFDDRLVSKKDFRDPDFHEWLNMVISTVGAERKAQ